MGVSTAGIVILVRFPFSDLSQAKLRPAVVVAEAGRGDVILCQITGNPYSDPRAITLTAADFQRGGLRVVSYARPGKLFTANECLIERELGALHAKALALRVLADRLEHGKAVPEMTNVFSVAA